MADFVVVGDDGTQVIVGSAPATAFVVSGALRGDTGPAGPAGAGGGTVTSVSSADANATVATGTTTPVITVVSAPKLLTPRTINGVAFDGTANITVADATKQPTITLTTTGTSGAATLVSNTLNIPQYTGGSGSVTSVSVTTANGVSGTVATATSTPAISLSLGAITPTSVAASGTVTGSNLSGTNTGDQTTVSGNAGTATKLLTARTIAGASFDGSASISLANKFIVQGTSDTGLSGPQFLGALGTGIVKNTTTTGVLSIATGADLPAMTATVGGAVPTPPNNTTTFLRGDGTFATPAGSGDMVLASAQTNTGAKTFNAGTFLDKGSHVYNVKAYGAVGNGSTDDTTAIQAAIDAASTAGGGIVFFPAATYKVTSLTLKSYVSLKGVSGAWLTAKGSIIKTAATTGDMLAYSAAAGLQSVIIQDLRLEGPASGTGNGIRLQNTGGSGAPSLNITFRNLKVVNFGASGIEVDCLITSVFDSVTVETCATGFYLNGGAAFAAPNTSITMFACYANGCTTTGYNMRSTVYSSFHNLAADDCGTAYLIDTCNALTFNACGCEWGNPTTATPADGFKLTGCQQVVLNAPYTFQNKHYSFWITGSSQGISMLSPQENTPLTATNSIKVDALSHLTVMNPNTTTAVSTAAGTTNYVDDGSGGSVTNGYGFFAGTVEVAGALIADTTITAGGVAVPTISSTSTLTNKTLTAPVISTITNTGTITIPTTTTTLAGLAIAQTWTAAQSFNSGNFKLNGATSGTTTVNATAVAGATTLTLPAATDTVVARATTDTLTNKRVTKRVITATSSATPTPTGDTADIWYLSTLTVGATFAAPTGTPTDGQELTIRIKSVAAQTLAWNAIYLASGVAPLPTTSVAGKTITIKFMYDTAQVKWVAMAVDATGY